VTLDAIDRHSSKRQRLDAKPPQDRLRLDAEEFATDLVVRSRGSFQHNHVASRRGKAAGRRRA
jgi:hypothetical protein